VSDGHYGSVAQFIHALFSGGTAGGLTDGQLLERFTARGEDVSEPAFAALVERHGPMVLRVCRSILSDEQDAEDAFQATFLVLARRAESLWVKKSLGPWLHGVAIRTASCARSSRIMHREHEQRAAASMPRVAVTEDGDDLGPILHEEIHRLPERYRGPILLCYFEGLTHEQAARHLDWPVGTVRSRLARARALLRTRLTRRGLAPHIASLSVFSGKIASPPDRLIDFTVKAATMHAASVALKTGLISASAAAMTEGVIHTMLVSKWKAIATVLLAVGAITSAMGLYARQPAGKPASSRDATKAIPGRNLEDLENHAADIEELLKRVRRKQAGGDLEGAARDLQRIERVASEWRLALANLLSQGADPHDGRPNPADNVAPLPLGPGPVPRSSTPSGGTPHRPESQVGSPGASEPGSTENRLAELERKIDRVLLVLAKDTGAKESAPPPNLVGRITKIDHRAGIAQINIGSDDGLVPGHELSVYRVDPAKRTPTSAYLGRIRVYAADPDEAAAKIVERTGEAKMKEGDQVSPRAPSTPGE
jgi:RNA polymerase sigma factor (sigma-70 family)